MAVRWLSDGCQKDACVDGALGWVAESGLHGVVTDGAGFGAPSAPVAFVAPDRAPIGEPVMIPQESTSCQLK